MTRRVCAALAAMAVLLSLSVAQAQPPRETPYWASISASRAMMRTGPGRNYPATWLYVRPDLPIEVIEVYQSWRKIRDPDGTTGWMLVNLLSDTRTAIVRGDAARPLHEEPDEASPVQFRVEPGVVGRISNCASGWCRFVVGRRGGFIRVGHIWGVRPDETVG
ncbi:SH3 domain-containing protein [Sphingosinicella sp. CPCC 101087]|uniref:SH3 domain-containing protein n=1 Tax=Sphingosinicella sp. CPCC 101087 TaxID=2497754 RepID=UPI00101C3C8D|nr:SH3 domain-containing protein [Sphingosinicella sp. CPCC 101087]